MSILWKKVVTEFWRWPWIARLINQPSREAQNGKEIQRATHQVPRYCSLDGFAEMSSSAEGIALRKLSAFDTIYVHTANGDYSIFLLEPEDGRALVQDGRLFVEPVEVNVSGSTFGGSMLKMGWIGIGLYLEMYAYGNRITTPVVLSFSVKHELSIPLAV